MTWLLLQVLSVIYVAGLLWMQRNHWTLLVYVWGAFGLAFLIVHLSILQNWHVALEIAEARHVKALMALFGVDLQIINDQTLLVPDSTGWSGLIIGTECSTLLELAVLTGLMVFYPQLPPTTRWGSLFAGMIGVYLLNLARILVIVVMVLIWGKPAVPFAHAVVARLFYFGGVIVLYWFLLTRPTLKLVRRGIETSERAMS